MRQISDELVAIIRDDKPGPESLSNTALLYLNRQTFDEMKRTMVPPDRWGPGGITQLFGIPIVLYHGIPLDRWELVQRGSGENITSGDVWEKSDEDH